MNPHQLDSMQIISRMGGFRFSWICSCGESEEHHLDDKRTWGLDGWKATAAEAHFLHGVHAGEATL